MNKQLRRRVALRKRVQRSLEANKVLTAIMLMWISSVIFGSFANVLTDLNSVLIYPYQWITTLESSAGMPGWVHFNVMFWPYIGVIWLIRSFVLYLWKRFVVRIDDESVTPLVLYKDEFAVAVEAIDQVSDTDPDEAILELIHTVAETIAVNLGLRKKDYRMMFFTPVPAENAADEEIVIAGFRLGKQFELVEKGKMDSERFYPRDLKNIEDCLEQDNTELVISGMAFGDAKIILFARNPGNLRLGLYIAVLKDDFDLELAKEVFPQVAHIVTTLGFVDEMVNFIVEYDK